MSLTTTAQKQAYKLRHSAAGLCIECPEKATRGNRCRKHWMINKATKRRYGERISNKRKEAGLCIDCARPLDAESDGESAVCINCTGQRLKPERGGNYR
jgi:hypothetical protein